LLRRLFELEVPEIFRGIVEIKSIAREAGYRSKVAVWSRQEGVDPVGACVGMRGIRIQNIVNELGGERIDVVVWDPEPSRFVANALSPAQVVSVLPREDTNDDGTHTNTAEVVVPDRQLSLAIGKEGQNARLAAKLTGWRIDIKSQSAYEEELASKGMTLEQVQEQAREEALQRAREIAEAEAETMRAAAAAKAAASTRPLTPEEEIAIEYARKEEEAAAAAAQPIEEPLAPAATTAAEPAPAAGGPARPAIRFAEELVRPPLEVARPNERRRGPPGRRDDEAGRALPKKKKGGARRILPEDEEEEVDLGDMEDLNW
jgi:N utilization substance protein A